MNVYESFGLIRPHQRVVGRRGARGTQGSTVGVVKRSGEEEW